MASTEEGEVEYFQDLMESNLVTKEEVVIIANEEGCLNDACEYISNDHGNDRDNESCVKYLLEMGCDRNNIDDKWLRPLDNVFV